MMKINGSITVLINKESTTIEIWDVDANLLIADITLDPEQLSMALSRLSNTPCKELKINDFCLDKLGKTMIYKSFEFELPDDTDYSNRVERAEEIIKKICPEGWISDNYFDSQNSFFTKNNKQYARCIIRTWVEKESHGD